jgi:PTS system mannose-specific IIB component/fructoselysine and glucoselysine-specific PTS system IIB component
MTIRLFRIDDRLIHGQVVVGWGQPLGVGFIVLVDDEVRVSDWEQDLYRMGVPPEIDVIFASATEAVERLAAWEADPRAGILLTGDIDAMATLCDGTGRVAAVNLGGMHHRAGRSERLRYVYLTADEAAKLRRLSAGGVRVTAQDVPSARAIGLEEFL